MSYKARDAEVHVSAYIYSTFLIFRLVYSLHFLHFLFTGRVKAIMHSIKSTPASVLFCHQLSWRKLSCVRWMLKRELYQRREKYRAILYKRLAQNEPLRTPAELTPLNILRIELGKLREHNLELCKCLTISAFNLVLHYLSQLLKWQILILHRLIFVGNSISSVRNLFPSPNN